MNKNHKLLIAYVFISALIPTLFFKASALEFANIIKDKVVLHPWIFGCGKVDDKIDARISHFEGKHAKHHETYLKLKDRLEQKIDYWESLGYDVDDLNEDLNNLDDKVDNFKTKYDAYLDKLKKLKDFTCETSLDEYKTKLEEVKDALKEVKSAATEIRKYYQQTIRPDILALKDQFVVEEE